MRPDRKITPELLAVAVTFVEEIRDGKWGPLPTDTPVGDHVPFLTELERRSPGYNRFQYERAIASAFSATD